MVPDGGTTAVVGLACCDATAEVHGVLRRIRRDRGCTESLRDALRGWFAVGGRPPGLMELVMRNYEILAMCKDTQQGGDGT